jgi:hypothetical protein
MNIICIGGTRMQKELCKSVLKNRKETDKRKILNKSHKKEAYIDFWIFLVYNSVMISQVILIIDRQTAEPIISRSKMR